MASGKPKIPNQKHTKSLKAKFKNPNPNRIPLGKNRVKRKKKERDGRKRDGDSPVTLPSNASASQQLQFFLDRFESANDVKLSSLELEGVKETCMVKLSEHVDQDAENLSKHMKATFGLSWKKALYEGNLVKGKIDAGSPALLVISASALRSLELLRGLRPLMRECRAAKLFAKHMKVEEQVSLLKDHVNIAAGTPSRIKKLIDMDALGLSRLSVVVLDLHTDAKGYSLFTLPQVSGEFWDLYKTHFHQRFLQGDLRICLYGQIQGAEIKTAAPLEE